MGLESVTNVADLNASWPLATDSRRQGDDHIRNLKVAVKSLVTAPTQLGLPTYAGNANEVVKVNAGATALDTVPQGTGGGLDADTVDGSHASAFSLAAHTHSGVYEPANANIQAHVASVANPHAVTKAQVGLTSVEDYGIASQAEAEAGTSNLKYMTPLRAAQAIAALGGAGGGAGLKSIQVFTAGGTWTRPAGVTIALIICIGGGGGGAAGSAAPTTGGGGGAGAFVIKVLDVSAISSRTVTIGGGGSAGLAGANTSFGSDCVSDGGEPGTTNSLGGAGGAAASSTGDVELQGCRGCNGAGPVTSGVGGSGGGWGGGAGGHAGGTSGTAGAANSGGGGGGGGANGSSAGGAGGSGICFVLEFGA